jgi:hypothetical protein
LFLYLMMQKEQNLDLLPCIFPQQHHT